MPPPSSNAPETVGVLSDTHLGECTAELLKVCETHFHDCERILHAGDVVSLAVLRGLAPRWEVLAVRGNMDFAPDLRELPRRRVVQVGGLWVGLRHGDGGAGSIESRLLGEFGSRPPPAIVYGHTHEAADLTFQGVRLLNPGSPTDRRWAPYRSVARLTINGDRIDFKIIAID
ncbi:MAG: metallophosphoesterase family protein [bacterium]